ncbi:hypothetical protein HanPI659440_Chr10g0399201 [Helianthus annuus]|nr:hypothetical protein HanPI659440_Chr10g0399201 [Helianthus annuus]
MSSHNLKQGTLNNFLKRKESCSSETPSIDSPSLQPIPTPTMPKVVDVDNLPWDPADRIKITYYHPNQRDEIRRKCWLNGPCQPRGHKFPQTKIGKKSTFPTYLV